MVCLILAFKTGSKDTTTKPTDIKAPFDKEKAKLKVKAAENVWNAEMAIYTILYYN